MTLEEIEEIERKYLNKYFYFFKYVEDEMKHGFKSMYEIKNDWEKYWSSKSSFSTGAERIIYGLLNGKAFGEPNSNPVSSDLLFEVDDAYIHIDVKTYDHENINDFAIKHDTNLNQTSYRCEIENRTKRGIRRRKSILNMHYPNLPTRYTKYDGGIKRKKICLTYFISILTDDTQGDNIVAIILTCVPNGLLKRHYKNRPLVSGKTQFHDTHYFPNGTQYTTSTARYCFADAGKFELLDLEPRRIKVVYANYDKLENYPDLTIIREVINEQENRDIF